jgi:putative ABC transport system permease protein
MLVKPGSNVEAVAARLDEMGVTAVTADRLFRAQIKMFESGLRVARRVAYALAGVMIFLAMGLLWNTISRIVSDSRPDIGLFRALGATKRDVRRLFLTEASLLGLMGTGLGIVTGWGVAAMTSRMVIGYARSSIVSMEENLNIPDTIFTFHPWFAVALLAVGLMLSMLAGLRPANRAANTDPVKALKRE